MDIDFFSRYRPLVATPFFQDDTYKEGMPCEKLRPYIRCYWGSSKPFIPERSPYHREKLIIPDTCMDILFQFNHRNGKIKVRFIGVSDVPVVVKWDHEQDLNSVFAVRLYFWAVPFFTRESMKDLLNQSIEAEAVLIDIGKMKNEVFRYSCFEQRVACAEAFMRQSITFNHVNPALLNGIEYMLSARPAYSLGDLSNHMNYSNRQAERIFKTGLGITPKKLMDLIRYQSLWRELVTNPDINIQAVVFKYGYTDYSHLLLDFKKYHTMSPRHALELSDKNKMSHFSYTNHSCPDIINSI